MGWHLQKWKNEDDKYEINQIEIKDMRERRDIDMIYSEKDKRAYKENICN